MGLLKRYKWVVILTIIVLSLSVFYPSLGFNIANITFVNSMQMLSVLPPIFIILGILDVWVPKELMIRLMGKDSGFIGGILAFITGSVAAGPLYAAFPVAQMLLAKEASLLNVFIFLGAWSTTKIPLFLFETSAMGIGFSLSRLLLNIPVILIIAYLTNKILSSQERISIYERKSK